jgi:hypothetical protein
MAGGFDDAKASLEIVAAELSAAIGNDARSGLGVEC